MQCFRLMGMPDKVIAFDELPSDMLTGFELCKAEGFTRAWKSWLGPRKHTIKIMPEINPITGQKRMFDPMVEEDSYFYLVDWNLKPNVEKWKQVEEYVRSRVPSDFRLMDKLEDMAKPLAPDKVSGITLEPDDVIVIPIPKEIVSPINQKKQNEVYSCEESGCGREFDAKQGLVMHKMKKHPKKEVIKEAVSV